MAKLRVEVEEPDLSMVRSRAIKAYVRARVERHALWKAWRQTYGREITLYGQLTGGQIAEARRLLVPLSLDTAERESQDG